MLFIKAILYRVIRMIIVFLSSFSILGDTSTALSIMSIDMVAATLFYYFFDRAWPSIESKLKSIVLLIKYRKLK